MIDMHTMVLALISSAIVGHLHAKKDKPMSPVIEAIILRYLATVLLVKTTPITKGRKSEISNNTTEDKDDTKSTDWNKIQDSHPEQVDEVYTNSWIQCAAVLERMFLLIWIVMYLSSIGLLIIMTKGAQAEWQNVWRSTHFLKLSSIKVFFRLKFTLTDNGKFYVRFNASFDLLHKRFDVICFSVGSQYLNEVFTISTALWKL